ncbi:chromosome segregation protein Spc25-domain-containing protein [Cristinia sonorae]|uniref:Kinetochore protein SPC25 n=1 Tax=Cristinia sonorae TaxID=1940300 RepID=A0A8K0UPZ7_9AGAR|nr:chromosome segregation protein Spc25-domain-containing protein [Cristinia sonorae]
MSKVIRVAKLDLATILQQQNPTIDLRIDAFEESTRNFRNAVALYSQGAMTEITRRKNEFAARKSEYAKRTKQVENETNACKVRELELMKVLEREQEERKEAETSVAAFRRQLASIKETCASLDVEIEQRRAVVENLKRERNRERTILNGYASQVSPELLELERRLQCYIEGIDKDKILVRFSHVDPHDTSREFSFVIDVSSRAYKVPTTTPYLPTLPMLVDELNESRDVFAFIKQMRQAFYHLVTDGR